MSPKNKKESALGKGLDALIRSDYLDDDENSNGSRKNEKIKKTENDTKETSETGNALDNEDIEIDADKKTIIQDSKRIRADETIIETVLVEVHKNPRISLWSAKSAAVLRFLKKTKPEFSISNEASLLIEEAVKDKHPEIWKLFEEKGL
jgi:hypothetical protein